jgi:1,4-dihydroxy-2-naphthoate octaprenyltransferase
MTRILNQAWNFIKLSRVQFLLGGLLLYALGAAAAARMGFTLNWARYLLGQGIMTSIQLMAQYLNEYYDFEVDSLEGNNRTWFSGGSGILATGKISPAAVLTAARICAVIAILAGVLAVYLSPWMIIIIGLSFLGSYFYSSPPITLMSSGWGEITTSIIVALMVPLAGYCMQGGFPSAELWLTCIPLILIHAAMLMVFEFPDREVDLLVAKKTLTVRLGLRGAAWVIDGLVIAAFLCELIFKSFSKSSAWWMGPAIILAGWQIAMVHWVLRSPTQKHYQWLTMGGVALFVLATLLSLFRFVFAG